MGDTTKIAIIGGGPAGLIAAEILARAGHAVTVYERKPTVARKFLLAGRGGLNITHSEPLEKFMARYGKAAETLNEAIRRFPPQAMREWCAGLGQPTFIGSSGRVFPENFKATPLLRVWLARLDELNVTFALQRRWTGWGADGALTFMNADNVVESIRPEATLLALGGASWPHLGADGSWVEMLARNGIAVAPLQPANCGFTVAWSDVFASKFAGQPLKNIRLAYNGQTVTGELMITARGVEGGAVYALSRALREAISSHGAATIMIDLAPGLMLRQLTEKLNSPRGGQSFSTWLQKNTALTPTGINLLREAKIEVADHQPAELARLIKALPIRLNAPFPLARAISSAGGICLEAMDENFMLKSRPGVFAAGEMLDWEAPTGGYLLQATFATAIAAAEGIMAWLAHKSPQSGV